MTCHKLGVLLCASFVFTSGPAVDAAPSTRSLVADNTRSWTGTLPENGDYTIIVEGDERGGTYSMTIGIK